MHKVVLVLAWLACISNGRRVLSSLQQSSSRPRSNTQRDMKSLVAMLSASSNALAFNPSSPGVQFPTHASLFPAASTGKRRNLKRNAGPLAPRRGGHPRFQVSDARASLAEKTTMQTQVEEIIAMNPMVMFSKTTCPFCAKAKQAIVEIGEPDGWTMVELDQLDPNTAAQVQDHLETLTGARTVPRVFIGHQCIGGGTDTVNLAASGELKSLITNAKVEHRSDLQGKDFSDLGKTEDDWKKELDPKVYGILRNRGTEYPGSHEYDQFYPEEGYFACAGCDLPLYSADSKFRSSCGWPVFDKCYHSEEIGCHVGTRPDGSGSLEIVCPRCAGHLGHVFFDAFTDENPNGERH
mmetsp:Transcript_144878/g.255371  ORF Transcript_144878/g.255371 Transcript_144878/m.255371 type:complete len:351 (-) Transcript_144878:123-1175(-)